MVPDPYNILIYIVASLVTTGPTCPVLAGPLFLKEKISIIKLKKSIKHTDHLLRICKVSQLGKYIGINLL